MKSSIIWSKCRQPFLLHASSNNRVGFINGNMKYIWSQFTILAYDPHYLWEMSFILAKLFRAHNVQLSIFLNTLNKESVQINRDIVMYTHLPIFGIIFIHGYYLNTPFPKLFYLHNKGDIKMKILSGRSSISINMQRVLPDLVAEVIILSRPARVASNTIS